MKRGGLHVSDISNTMGPLSGVGLLTGNAYRSTETVKTVSDTNGRTPQFEQTIVMSQVIHSQGGTPDFVTHTTVHVTVNSNGFPTADVLNTKADCSGQN